MPYASARVFFSRGTAASNFHALLHPGDVSSSCGNSVLHGSSTLRASRLCEQRRHVLREKNFFPPNLLIDGYSGQSVQRREQRKIPVAMERSGSSRRVGEHFPGHSFPAQPAPSGSRPKMRGLLRCLRSLSFRQPRSLASNRNKALKFAPLARKYSDNPQNATSLPQPPLPSKLAAPSPDLARPPPEHRSQSAAPRLPTLAGKTRRFSSVEEARREFRNAMARKPRDRDGALRAWKFIVKEGGSDLLTNKDLIRFLFTLRVNSVSSRPTAEADFRRNVAATVAATYASIRKTGRPPNADMVRQVALAYAKAGSVDLVQKLAREAMDEMPGLGLENADVFEVMAQINSNTHEPMAVLNDLAEMLESTSDAVRLELLYGTLIEAMFKAAELSDSEALRSAIALAQKCNIPPMPRMFEAQCWFHAVLCRDLVAALQLLTEADEKHVRLSVNCYNHILEGMISTGHLTKIADLFDQMKKRRIDMNARTYRLLLTMYDPEAEYGTARPSAAVKTFEAMLAAGHDPRMAHRLALAKAVMPLVAAPAPDGLEPFLITAKPSYDIWECLRDGFTALKKPELAFKVSDIYLKLSADSRNRLPIRTSWLVQHLRLLILSGRADKWREVLTDLNRHGIVLKSEMCDVILTHYKDHRSTEAAGTARELFDRMRACRGSLSLIILEAMLLTEWNPEKNAPLSSDALRYIEAFAERVDRDGEARLRDSKLLRTALEFVKGGNISQDTSVPGETSEIAREKSTAPSEGADTKVTTPARARAGVKPAQGTPVAVPASDLTSVPVKREPKNLIDEETPSPALDAIKALVAEGRAAEWEATFADLLQKGESLTRGTYLTLLAHYAAQPRSPESAASARGILAHQLSASTTNWALTPDATAFAHVLATTWKAEFGEALSDEALDVLSLFAKTHPRPPELRPNRRPPAAEPLFQALRIVSGKDQSHKKGLEILRLRGREWETTLAELEQQGKSPTLADYLTLLASYAVQPCSPKSAATARSILAHQFIASVTDPSLLPDATAFAHVLATAWKAEPDEALSDEALDILALFARTHERHAVQAAARRPPVVKPLYEALGIVAGDSRDPTEGLRILRSEPTDVKRKWAPADLAFFARKAAYRAAEKRGQKAAWDFS
ncbi:hypothetical protein BDK51DRAFT_44608 [Blyttiomyces helicus]|uniref:Pentacotripeptide-repeat region of PRORP domain-containing protein n=1 Tax=Blyttiomyces helicus TaxID=388810 RepID=A0A4P9WMA5_9FUNG|nr:hypothetical protein BDK51DRAFT_44608 [Blyttiomyces helicus]|eukprot:RKO93592.1 hypothetical protein BDK51DRAFT_44608 [Blyttiomyces helicus]